jgi:glycine/D-amino acid oxidase-like deaminating enzyme
MSETFDAAIAGGAAIGFSTAYHLAAAPSFAGRVLVVERDMSHAKASSVRARAWAA